jgi:hypothetical protein
MKTTRIIPDGYTLLRDGCGYTRGSALYSVQVVRLGKYWHTIESGFRTYAEAEAFAVKVSK